MRFSRVLLVHPAHNVEWPGLTPPIGLGYLAQTLQANGIEYDVFDMNLGYKPKHLYKKIDRFQPDLLGVSLITSEYKRFYDMLRSVKRHSPALEIVVVGPHVTIFGAKVLEECSAVDYNVVREGEGTLVEMCRDEVSLNEIKGLMHRNNAKVIYNGDREFARDIDALPWPRYEKFELAKYFSEINIYSSRGCPYHCIFCARPCLSSKYRARSAENVGDELQYWYEKGYREFILRTTIST